jgi:hypothetical protein
LLAASLAQQVEARMPITYFNKPCPGAHGSGCCTWSTELQGEQALIPEEGILCPVCMVKEGLRGDRLQLQLHLADLYMLDTDQFRKAREAIGDGAFKGVRAATLQILTSRVPTLKRAREDQRKMCLARTLSLLTEGSWTIQCWANRVAEDTRDLCQCEAAIGHLPVPIRGSIYEFLCGDARKLCAHLCAVKRRGYHTLEQPLFWHPPGDAREAGADDDRPARAIFAPIYSYVATHMHKPKLQSLKRSLVNHEHFVKRNWAMKRHGCLVRKAIGLLDSMLKREITVVEGPSFELGPVA